MPISISPKPSDRRYRPEINSQKPAATFTNQPRYLKGENSGSLKLIKSTPFSTDIIASRDKNSLLTPNAKILF